MHFDEWLLVSSVLLLLSILAWKVSNRLGIPSLLLFLGIGMLAGSDGPGGIYFDNASVAQAVGIVALAFILFAGGLDTEWKVVRPALGGALALSTIGVLLTAAVVAVFALLLLHVSFLFYCSPGERPHDSASCEDVPSGKALRFVGGIAGSRSDCVSDLPTPGRAAQSLASLRPGLLRGLRLRTASGHVCCFCRQVVGGYHS